MITLICATGRAIRAVVWFFVVTWLIIMALHILTGCSRQPSRDARNRHELNQRVFVNGTTEALRGATAKPNKPALPVQRF